MLRNGESNRRRTFRSVARLGRSAVSGPGVSSRPGPDGHVAATGVVNGPCSSATPERSNRSAPRWPATRGRLSACVQSRRSPPGRRRRRPLLQLDRAQRRGDPPTHRRRVPRYFRLRVVEPQQHDSRDVVAACHPVVGRRHRNLTRAGRARSPAATSRPRRCATTAQRPPRVADLPRFPRLSPAGSVDGRRRRP